MVLAAGEGKRLRPLTYTRPKCMIPLGGKPILEHVLLTVKEAGIKEAIIVVKYMEEKIRGYFGDGSRLGMKIRYVRQGEVYGTGAAFMCARDYVDDDFLGIAGDIITEARAVRRVVEEDNAEVVMALKEVDDREQFGIAELKGERVVKFVEKPPGHLPGLANCSIYRMGIGIFDVLEKCGRSTRNEVEITDAIKKLVLKREVKGIVLKKGEYWLDMGMPWQIFNANEFILNRMKEKKGEIENSVVKGKVIMGKGARIYSSYIEGPLYVGDGTEIGPHAYIRGATSIGKNCAIGDSTTIKNSILLDDVKAKHLTYIGDSIIGEGCNFGASTQIANYRFDGGYVKTDVNGKVVVSDRRKFGTVIGDFTKTGVLSCVMPGKTIGDNCWIGAGVVIDRPIGRNMKVFLQQKLKIMKR
ncbi:MAG: sugar phosphate nucleotidyltransferase [Candidatus Micrarchaeia archaeon]